MKKLIVLVFILSTYSCTKETSSTGTTNTTSSDFNTNISIPTKFHGRYREYLLDTRGQFVNPVLNGIELSSNDIKIIYFSSYAVNSPSIDSISIKDYLSSIKAGGGSPYTINRTLNLNWSGTYTYYYKDKDYDIAFRKNNDTLFTLESGYFCQGCTSLARKVYLKY